MKKYLLTLIAATLTMSGAIAADEVDLELNEFSQVAVEELDANGNGMLDASEFAELMSDAPLPPSLPIEKAFVMADLDGNAGVTAEELYRFLLVMDASSKQTEIRSR